MNEVNSIEWHKENLKNSKNYEERLEREFEEYIKNQKKRIDNIKKENKFRQFQIEFAEKENKKFFTDKYKFKQFNKNN